MILAAAPIAAAQGAKFEREVRARDLGVPFEGTPGPLDAITDVKGVEVGYRTLISGDGKLVVGNWAGAHGRYCRISAREEFRGSGVCGMVHGKRQWRDDRDDLGGGIRISLRAGDDHEHAQRGSGARRVIAWQLQHGPGLPLEDWWSLPVVAETWDGYLNDINGFHVKAEDADAAMRDAHGGPIAEGNVGGGTGMICFEFKGGTGTASRQLPEKLGGYTVGVLVQCNFGTRHLLRIAGAPVGYEITGHPRVGRRYRAQSS